MARIVLWGCVSLAVLALLIQAIPVRRVNGPVEADVKAPPDVERVLRRACYDCHSNETVWPGYSRVAPASWLVAHDVHDGRNELNFSIWNRYDTVMRRKKLDRARDEVKGGDMPPAYYVWMHPNARLSDADKAFLEKWFSTR
jgi:cytochrome c551/c552